MSQSSTLGFLSISSVTLVRRWIGGVPSSAAHAMSPMNAQHARLIMITIFHLMRAFPRLNSTKISIASVRYKTMTLLAKGMVKIGDRFFISSVEIIEPTQPCPVPCDGYDRTPGRGVGHLFVVDAGGALLADVRLGEGHMYHPGGIDYDGRWLWVPVAEYRPNSNAIVYRVEPNSLAVEEVFRVRDHIGGVVRDRVDGHVHGVSWD